MPFTKMVEALGLEAGLRFCLVLIGGQGRSCFGQLRVGQAGGGETSPDRRKGH